MTSPTSIRAFKHTRDLADAERWLADTEREIAGLSAFIALCNDHSLTPVATKKWMEELVALRNKMANAARRHRALHATALLLEKASARGCGDNPVKDFLSPEEFADLCRYQQEA